MLSESNCLLTKSGLVAAVVLHHQINQTSVGGF
jgi:hypothetical protein